MCVVNIEAVQECEHAASLFQGIPVDYPEFVVYDNRRSMIEYIVTFDEVSYRAPPSVYNFYTNQIPALYKVEPIVLPIPEEELDKMYMLGPDTGQIVSFCLFGC